MKKRSLTLIAVSALISVSVNAECGIKSVFQDGQNVTVSFTSDSDSVNLAVVKELPEGVTLKPAEKHKRYVLAADAADGGAEVYRFVMPEEYAGESASGFYTAAVKGTDEEKAEKIKDIYFNVYEVRKELERNARELKNELNANPKIFKSSRIIKPNWTINICIELSKYFYNECEFIIEIYIGVNDSYEVFIYFRKNSKVLKFDEKLDKFMKDITANFYKNFELSKGEYDELMANLNKEKLFELVKCIEENCSKLKSKNNI